MTCVVTEMVDITGAPGSVAAVISSLHLPSLSGTTVLALVCGNSVRFVKVGPY